MADFLTDFVTLTDNGLAPERFRIWAALSTVAVALDRRVWTSTLGGVPIYPNLFIMLVAKPGVGKSQAINPARSLLETQPHVELSASSASYEAFIRALAERTPDEDTLSLRSTMGLLLSEWGTFLRRPDNDTLSMLADIYDNGSYKHSTIGRGEDHAENLYINILAGCTPAWFAEGFPPNSYEQGLPTRFQFIYSEAVDILPDFTFDIASGDDDIGDPVTRALFPRLDIISTCRGFVRWSRDAGVRMNAWKADGFAPVPRDPMLSGYNTRRHLHLAKMALLVAVSTHPTNMMIELDDWERAFGILTEAEKHMPLAISAAGGNIYQLRQELIIKFVTSRFKELGGGVPEWEVRQNLGRHVPPNLLNSILDALISQQLLRVMGTTKSPFRKLKPGVRK